MVKARLKAKDEMRVPQEVREDKPEDERKYKIGHGDFRKRARKLSEIFNFVVQRSGHFQLTHSKAHAKGFKSGLQEFFILPVNAKPPRKRYYWATINLDGYKTGDKAKAEVRTEEKIGKGFHEQTLKLPRGMKTGGSTLSREEHKRGLDGFGTNLSVYDDAQKELVNAALGDRILKPLVELQGQSRSFMYHPDGRKDLIFEIKFDLYIGTAFDRFEDYIIEVEIEVAQSQPHVSEDDIEKMLNKSEKILFSRFSDDMEPIYESKAMSLFRHLVGWRERDQKGFEKAFDDLPGNRWTMRKQKSSRKKGPSLK